MKKTILALAMLIGVANATDVAICKFKGAGLSGYATDKVMCSGAIDDTTTIQNLYSKGWRYKGSYNMKDDTYVVMEYNARELASELPTIQSKASALGATTVK